MLFNWSFLLFLLFSPRGRINFRSFFSSRLFMGNNNWTLLLLWMGREEKRACRPLTITPEFLFQISGPGGGISDRKSDMGNRSIVKNFQYTSILSSLKWCQREKRCWHCENGVFVLLFCVPFLSCRSHLDSWERHHLSSFARGTEFAMHSLRLPNSFSEKSVDTPYHQDLIYNFQIRHGFFFCLEVRPCHKSTHQSNSIFNLESQLGSFFCFLHVLNWKPLALAEF